LDKHPNYEAVIQKAKDAGFEVRFSGEASMTWTELYDLSQNFVRIEKILNVAAGMRYRYNQKRIPLNKSSAFSY
jgi:hypothetical protein